jgi:hypothetical protein
LSFVFKAVIIVLATQLSYFPAFSKLSLVFDYILKLLFAPHLRLNPVELMFNYLSTLQLLFMKDPWAQVIGLIAMIIGVSAFWQKDDAHLKRNLSLYTLLMGVQFAMLDLWASALAAWLGTLRTYISMRTRNSWAMWALIILILLATLPTLTRLVGLLPIAGSLIGTWAMFREQGIRMRALMFVGTLCWVSHNYLVGSIGGTIIEATFLIINAKTIITLIRQELALSKNHSP